MIPQSRTDMLHFLVISWIDRYTDFLTASSVGYTVLVLVVLAQHPVKPFHRVCGINEFAYFLGILEIRGQFRPVGIPGTQDLRILLAPSFPELLQVILRVLQRARSVDQLQTFLCKPFHYRKLQEPCQESGKFIDCS